MATQSGFIPDRVEVDRQGNARRIALLVSSLILVVNERAGADAYSGASAHDQQILLDVEMDGVRCILMKQPHTPDRISFSPREIEVARMVAKGYPNKTIALVLDISANTVNTYLRRIFAKLGVSTRAAMVARLMEITVVPDGSETTPTLVEPPAMPDRAAVIARPALPQLRDNPVVQIDEW